MHVIRNNRLEEVPDDDPEVDFILESPAKHWSTHINMIPLQSAVQSPRLFYGARFVNQALSLENGEAPLVQNLDPTDKEGRSFDEILGNQMGIQRAKGEGQVVRVTPDAIRVRLDDGTEEDHELYRDQAFNQKSGITSRPLVKPGDRFTKGQLLAATNYTDDNGTVNMGLNARVGLVPWNGHTMDDAIALSESFAKRFKAAQYKVMKQDSSDNLRADLNHFRSLFPTRFPKEILANFDEQGLVKPGTVLKPGDPVLLATMPRTLSSAGANVGKLSKALAQSRRDASMLWEGNSEATVIDSRMTKNGYKVVLKYSKALEEGDKVTFRQGGKGTVSKVIPDDRMPRTQDGQPLEVMLNPLSLVSRANPATAHELRLGKVARALGKPIKIPSYLPKGQTWDQFIREQEAAAGVSSLERVFDPETNRELTEPIAVGYGFLNRLHHTSESKSSARGVAGYDCFDDRTEVLTGRGWIRWPDVMDSDLLMVPSLDLSTAALEKPSRLVSYDFNGDLLTYESRFLDWAVTNNHRFLEFRREKGGRGPVVRSFVTAVDLRDRTMGASVPQFGPKCEGYNAPVKVIPATANGRSLRNRDPLVLPFDTYAALMGWWIAEGSVQPEAARVFIWQCAKVNGDHSEEIRKLLKSIVGVDPLDHEGRGWRVTDRRLSEFLRKHGSDCYDKRIPRDIIEAGKPAVDAFLDAYTKGDGSISVLVKKDGRLKANRVHMIGSASRGLMDDFQELLMRRGEGLIVKKTAEAGRRSSFPSGGSYVCEAFYSGAVHSERKLATVVPGKGKARYTGKWGLSPYSGKVYCATTTTGLLIVRRNGKPCITGNSNEQPLRGGHSEGAQAKRFSGLENAAAMSAGAYALMRENATLRGSRNDDYWRALRAGRSTPTPGTPFVMHKFRALLSGAGINTREVGGGRVRLAPFTDKDLDERDPVEIENGNIVDTRTLAPIKGGLFDPRIVTGEKWGRIKLPRPVPNPAYTDSIRVLLGLSNKEMDAILRGEEELPQKLRERLGLDKPEQVV